MLEIREVRTGREKRDFLNFPLKLYKDNPYFVPPLYMDEKKIFNKNYVYYDTCEAVYFNAYRDGKMVGRISGILQKVSNELRHENRVRFIRFDSQDDQETARALFDAVEKWALSKGMDTVVGPLSFSDLEREGLLIEGFDQLSTFEEQYNAEYYGRLIEGCGYAKEVDWLESKVMVPDEIDEKFVKMSEFVLKRYNLHFAKAKNTNDFLKRYADGFFKLLDSSYANIYGTVPFTEGMKKMMIANFKLIIDIRYVALIVDENDEVVCLGLCFPSIAKAMQASNGHLTPRSLYMVLKSLKHPEIIDLGLIGVRADYINRGIVAAVCVGLMNMLRDNNLKWAQTNLNLEDNHAILNMWKRFKTEQHKRRRSYVKKLTTGDDTVG